MVEPESFAAELQSDWSLWVVERGLPALPASLPLDSAVPVARWVGPEVAGVLHVRYLSDAVDGLELDSDVEVLVREGEHWEVLGGDGGTGWFDPPFVRPAIDDHSADTWCQYSTGTANRAISALYGVAGCAATRVEVVDSAGTHAMTIESPLGAFVAVSAHPDSGVLRVRTADGSLLHTDTFAVPDRPMLWHGERLATFIEMGEAEEA